MHSKLTNFNETDRVLQLTQYFWSVHLNIW